MAGKPVVWIIDEEQWPRAYLKAELDEGGCEAIGYAHLSEAVADLRLGAIPRPKAIVLDLHNQYVEAILLEALAQTGIPVVLLTGSVGYDGGISKGYGWAAVVRRPFTIGSVVDKVREIVGFDSNGLKGKGTQHNG